MSDHAASISTPIELHFKLSRDGCTPLSQPTRYRKLMDYLIYLFVARPDISQIVHILSQFVSALTPAHHATLQRALLSPKHHFSIITTQF